MTGEQDLLFFQDLFAKMGINWGHAPIGFGVGLLFLPPKGEIYGLEISFFWGGGGRASEVDRLCWDRKSLNPEAPAERGVQKFGFCQLLRE